MIGNSGGYYGVIQEQVAHARCSLVLQNSLNKAARSDEALMTAYVGGDMSAFAELFRRYAPVLERMLWRSLRDEVPDFVQQTFLNLHRARSSFTEGALFRPWLLSIAFNLKREHFRRLNRRRAIDAELFTFSPKAPSQPDSIYEADQAWRALGSLPARERQVLELLCGSGLTAAAIASEMQTTIAGVKSLAHRARQRLRGSHPDTRGQARSRPG